MGLVDYSTSDEDEPSPDEPSSRRRRLTNSAVAKDKSEALPSLPETFRDLYAVAPRLSTRDDASLHQGRKRAVPHVEGNWPTHIYLECKCRAGRENLVSQRFETGDSNGD